MITDEQRSNMAANLVEFLVELKAKAARDSDPISMEGFTDEGGVVGAVVLIRGSDVFEDFVKWAAEHGYYAHGKGIIDGTETVAAPERGSGPRIEVDSAPYAQELSHVGPVQSGTLRAVRR